MAKYYLTENEIAQLRRLVSDCTGIIRILRSVFHPRESAELTFTPFPVDTGSLKPSMNSHLRPVPLEKSLRLINHGPTVLVSAGHEGVDNVMAAAWVRGLDFAPPKITAVLASTSKTRELAEKSGCFAIQVPTVKQAQLVHAVGNSSLRDDPEKLKHCGAELFRIDGTSAPLVAGCSAWLACRIIPDAYNQKNYDMIIGEIVGAWADDRVFRNGHWEFETADADWRSLHYVAGGHFYAIGDPVRVADESDD